MHAVGMRNRRLQVVEGEVRVQHRFGRRLEIVQARIILAERTQETPDRIDRVRTQEAAAAVDRQAVPGAFVTLIPAQLERGVLDGDHQVGHARVIALGVQIGGDKLANRVVQAGIKAVMIPVHGSGIGVRCHEVVL
jgi:hypothetical protein